MVDDFIGDKGMWAMVELKVGKYERWFNSAWGNDGE